MLSLSLHLTELRDFISHWWLFSPLIHFLHWLPVDNTPSCIIGYGLFWWFLFLNFGVSRGSFIDSLSLLTSLMISFLHSVYTQSHSLPAQILSWIPNTCTRVLLDISTWTSNRHMPQISSYPWSFSHQLKAAPLLTVSHDTFRSHPRLPSCLYPISNPIGNAVSSNFSRYLESNHICLLLAPEPNYISCISMKLDPSWFPFFYLVPQSQFSVLVKI